MEQQVSQEIRKVRSKIMHSIAKEKQIKLEKEIDEYYNQYQEEPSDEYLAKN